MAIDNAVDSGQLNAGLTTVADAIRAKGGTSAQLSFPNGMAVAIAALPSGGKVYQAAIDVGVSTSTSYVDAGMELTVEKTGTYKVSWEGFRTTTSGTAGSQMYKNGTAYGTAVMTFGNLGGYGQVVILEHVSLQAGDNLKIYARSRGSGYGMYVGGLLIEEE